MEKIENERKPKILKICFITFRLVSVIFSEEIIISRVFLDFLQQKQTSIFHVKEWKKLKMKENDRKISKLLLFVFNNSVCLYYSEEIFIFHGFQSFLQQKQMCIFHFKQW